MIERLRQSGIRIDAEGQFIHEGGVVEHAGLREALFRWLDRLPDGRYVLRLDQQRYAYVDVDDTPIVVRALRLDGARVTLSLSDGADEPLDPTTLTVDEDGVLRCWVRGGRLEARLATSAVASLSDLIVLDGGGGAGGDVAAASRGPGPQLNLGDQRYPLLPRRPSAPRP